MEPNLQNSTNTSKVLYKDLSYEIVGILIEIHKELGPYAREKQCCDLFEKKIKEHNLPYKESYGLAIPGML